MTFSVEGSTKLQLKRWLIFLLSPVVWTISFTLVYLIDEAACGLHFWRWFVWREVTAVTPLMLLVLLFTLALTLLNVFLGWQIWHRAQHNASDEAERDRFIGLAALMMGSLFSFLTLGLVTAVVVLPPC
jgi:fatty-acid desaturase